MEYKRELSVEEESLLKEFNIDCESILTDRFNELKKYSTQAAGKDLTSLYEDDEFKGELNLIIEKGKVKKEKLEKERLEKKKLE